jgi:hypothetical protein
MSLTSSSLDASAISDAGTKGNEAPRNAIRPSSKISPLLLCPHSPAHVKISKERCKHQQGIPIPVNCAVNIYIFFDKSVYYTTKKSTKCL